MNCLLPTILMVKFIMKYGEKRNKFLNKLTPFDFRLKKLPAFSMAQTLIAKIDCSIFNLKDKYIITCNKSYEDFLKTDLKYADLNN